MKPLREFDIAFVGLKPGEHSFQYTIGDSFFDNFEEPKDFSNCEVTVQLTLDKKSSFFLLKFAIGGKVTVTCDRCGEAFDMQLWDDFNQVIKLADNPEELASGEEDPDVSYISRTESHLNVADYIYEFIYLSIPMQRIHPNNGCNPKVIEMLEQMNQQAKENDNPIWKGLDKFKDN
ncbi:DUF177 domain-containing protein [Chitinophaga sp. 212800010-3]|uniref:YceD family protein n=1 Tax=unclassified Chitinophaga TaxID=2619133 RepID=UPI002DEB2608|nr:DUF177 domain-containing protein [Chitinophaga sp. 212800010-3]